jgi:sarcosine oxidase subunit beta
MPEKADVVIIGGGVMGCAIAYNLAKQGLKPVVIEKSDIGGEASGSNGGGVRQSARNLKEMPLAIRKPQVVYIRGRAGDHAQGRRKSKKSGIGARNA